MSGLKREAKRVLVVDANQGFRSALRATLSAYGYRAFDARDTMEAVTVARTLAGTVHLLITDLALPDGNGIALARKLLPRYPLMRMLVVSDYCDDVCFLDQGMCGRAAFMSKRATNSALISKVREILGSDVVAAELRRRPQTAALCRPRPSEPNHRLVRIAQRIARNRAQTRRLHRNLCREEDSLRMLSMQAASLAEELGVQFKNLSGLIASLDASRPRQTVRP